MGDRITGVLQFSDGTVQARCPDWLQAVGGMKRKAAAGLPTRQEQLQLMRFHCESGLTAFGRQDRNPRFDRLF